MLKLNNSERNSNQNNKIQFSPITLAHVKKTNNIQSWQKCTEIGTLLH